METSSIITIIVCLTIMGAAIYYYYMACKVYDKADMMRIEAEVTNETTRDLENFLKCQLAIGEPIAYTIDSNELCCMVFAEYETPVKDKKTCELIKCFPYGDDKSYALREAQYLLQTLNEK